MTAVDALIPLGLGNQDQSFPYGEALPYVDRMAKAEATLFDDIFADLDLRTPERHHGRDWAVSYARESCTAFQYGPPPTVKP
jgi:hypothetical protein